MVGGQTIAFCRLSIRAKLALEYRNVQSDSDKTTRSWTAVDSVHTSAIALALIFAFVAGQHSASAVAALPPARWEYRIVGSIHTVDQINKLDEDGWEAVTLNASNSLSCRRLFHAENTDQDKGRVTPRQPRRYIGNVSRQGRSTPPIAGV